MLAINDWENEPTRRMKCLSVLGYRTSAVHEQEIFFILLIKQALHFSSRRDGELLN